MRLRKYPCVCVRDAEKVKWKPKKELVRGEAPEEEISLDLTGKKPGRGA